MSHRRREYWQNRLPRQFSAIYKMEDLSRISFVSFELPQKFTTATDARNFAERWNPNPSYRGTITTMAVCEPQFVEDKLKIYRDPLAKPRILTLVETEKL